MYRFGTKKNREDVIALRWPKACLTCGAEVEESREPRYAILGKFHEVKNTQVLLKLAGLFYTCEACQNIISLSLDDSSSKVRKMAESLSEHPWNVLIELEKDGCIKLPDGTFKDLLMKLNPELCVKGKKNPIDILLKLK